jgi:hypothetical protein
MIAVLRFEAIPISGNHYSQWIGPGGRGKRLVNGIVRYTKKFENPRLYLTLAEYKKRWQIWCQQTWRQAGEPVFEGSVRITPILWRWNRSQWYDPTNLWQGLKLIEDALTRPIEPKNFTGKRIFKKFGLGMLQDDRHNQVYHGHPEWIKPGPDDERGDRMILIIEEYTPPGLWGRDKFVDVWNGRRI